MVVTVPDTRPLSAYEAADGEPLVALLCLFLIQAGGAVLESATPPRALGALAHEVVVTEDGPPLYAQLRTVTFRCEPRRSPRPCHLRAISSGHERYAAVNHGHSRRPLRWAPAH